MSELSLHKTEKLCSRTAVNRLFAEGKPAKAYPLRAVYSESNRTYGAAAQFMITIPKKKIRKAVGRVLLRRRVREAYRLNRHLLLPALESTGKKVDIAFIYVSDEAKSYHSIEKRVQAILSAVAAGISQEQQTGRQ